VARPPRSGRPRRSGAPRGPRGDQRGGGSRGPAAPRGPKTTHILNLWHPNFKPSTCGNDASPQVDGLDANSGYGQFCPVGGPGGRPGPEVGGRAASRAKSQNRRARWLRGASRRTPVPPRTSSQAACQGEYEERHRYHQPRTVPAPARTRALARALPYPRAPPHPRVPLCIESAVYARSCMGFAGRRRGGRKRRSILGFVGINGATFVKRWLCGKQPLPPLW
jgi:hypothetical protein